MGKQLLTVLYGLAELLLPRQVLKLAGRVLLAGYENPDDLEPKDWYVKGVRIKGAVTVLVGLVGLALNKRRGSTEKDEAES